MAKNPRLFTVRTALAPEVSVYSNFEGEREYVEERAITMLARDVHKAGYKFCEWPSFDEIKGLDQFDIRYLDAEVWAVPR